MGSADISFRQAGKRLLNCGMQSSYSFDYTGRFFCWKEIFIGYLDKAFKANVSFIDNKQIKTLC
jgi:hypothetical protein